MTYSAIVEALKEIEKGHVPLREGIVSEIVKAVKPTPDETKVGAIVKALNEMGKKG